jgi:hypothetical protein
VNDRLRTLLCCLVLQAGSFTGVPMRPEQVQDLMHALNNPKVAQTDPEGHAAGDEPDASESPATTN